MADTAVDQQAAAVSSGGQPADTAAAPSGSASDPVIASSNAPATSDATEKPQDPTPTKDTTPASAAPPSAPVSAPQSTEAPADTEKDAAAASAPAPTGESSAATNGTPSSSKKNSSKRKSTEPKGKSLKKKQSMRELHLNVEPGQLWWVRMKGYPNWPAIVCDEDMLPATLLEKRPVSAARTDGSYREDFMDGGKNARDRRYPVMFLGTNEFYWQVNTDLMPLDIQEIKDEVGKGERGKKSQALWNAYEIAAEEHGLDYFKGILKSHEEQLVQELQEKAEREALKAEKEAEKEAQKEAKKQARKNKTDADGDVEMDGSEGSKKKKAATKKRKEPTSGEAEEEQKGPKKIKIKNKGADEADTESAQKSKKEKKSKPKASKDETPSKSEEPQLTEQQKLEKKEKHILYLRHRLQKGFLSRDHPPKEEEMADMTGHLKQLEDDPNLEVSVIRNTKINKVLKAILKIDSIPKEEEYNFKSRSTALLSKWNEILGTPAETTATADTAKPAVNGEQHADTAPKSEEPDTAKKEDSAALEKKDEPVETTNNLGNDAKDEGDVAMKDAQPAQSADSASNPSAPAVEAAPISAVPSA